MSRNTVDICLKKRSYRQKAQVIFRLSDIFSDVATFDDWYRATECSSGTQRFFLLFKEGQRSPMFQVTVELWGRGQVGKPRQERKKRGQTVKRVQSIFCQCPGTAWWASVDYDTGWLWEPGRGCVVQERGPRWKVGGGEGGFMFQDSRWEDGKQTGCSKRGPRARFGSEVAVGAALARTATVVAPLPMAVPPVLPALPPALMVVAPVAADSSSWQGEDREGEETSIRVRRMKGWRKSRRNRWQKRSEASLKRGKTRWAASPKGIGQVEGQKPLLHTERRCLISSQLTVCL